MYVGMAADELVAISWAVVPALFGVAAGAVAGVGTLVLAGAFLLGGKWAKTDVVVDAKGIAIRRRNGSEHVLWAECTAVRRLGRSVEVLRGERWQSLPSPNGVTDAQWMESVVREQIGMRGDEPAALPDEAAAALRGLRRARARRER
jgi:hypothetical protein